jgi:adenosine deaminase
MDFTDQPKVELHLHLDCSLSYAVVAKIAPGISQEQYQRDFIAPPRCHDLAQYLSHAQHSIRLMQTTHSLEWVTADLVQQLAREKVVYAEIRFAPLLHTQQGLTPEAVVETVSSALARATALHGLEARLILCTLRHFSAAQSLETARLAARYRQELVAGFDIAGDEAGYPLEPQAAAFRYAHEQGIPCTAHAGEARGPESVWETLRLLRPQRLGHGVRSLEDPRLLEHLLAQGLHLELCPSSNVQTGIYPTIAQHPAEAFRRQGLPCSINTDGRTLSATSLAQEYRLLHQAFGWDAAAFHHANLQALEAAFIPAELKQLLRQRLEGLAPGG